ncbi:MAG: hypothetical protein E3J41_08020 [Candidatus Cloacimonadota bacterium]|nr:MAG: hypothetical protein E3J41_08020 [Candidatus Cloacimonadota bacterium]
MAKPYKHAALICIVVTILAAIGIIIGLLTLRPIITIIFLLPAVIYEVYRTEGKSTKLAAWVLLIVFIVEIILVAANISFNLATFFGETEKWIAGHRVPLGDIKVVGPVIMAILSIILFVRTRGRYTKWLAVIIFVTCFAIVYTLDPTVFSRLVRIGVKEGLEKIH